MEIDTQNFANIKFDLLAKNKTKTTEIWKKCKKVIFPNLNKVCDARVYHLCDGIVFCFHDRVVFLWRKIQWNSVHLVPTFMYIMNLIALDLAEVYPNGSNKYHISIVTKQETTHLGMMLLNSLVSWSLQSVYTTNWLQ